jgi:hypothetical protein
MLTHAKDFILMQAPMTLLKQEMERTIDSGNQNMTQISAE